MIESEFGSVDNYSRETTAYRVEGSGYSSDSRPSFARCAKRRIETEIVPLG